MIKVKNSKGKGRGVFASRKIKKGTIVERSPLITFNKKDTELLENTLLDKYCFEYKKDRVCLALGVGSLFNHDMDNNIVAILNYDKNVMEFKTTKEIYKGEELYINYGYELFT